MKLSKAEASLLLYLEARAVDWSGLADQRNMNDEDIEIAKRWDREGLIQFGRLKAVELDYLRQKSLINRTHYVRLSWKAFRLAASERRARAERTIKAFETNHFYPVGLHERDLATKRKEVSVGPTIQTTPCAVCGSRTIQTVVEHKDYRWSFCGQHSDLTFMAEVFDRDCRRPPPYGSDGQLTGAGVGMTHTRPE